MEIIERVVPLIRPHRVLQCILHNAFLYVLNLTSALSIVRYQLIIVWKSALCNIITSAI